MPRRAALTAHGEQLLGARRRPDDVLVLLLDVDRFKHLNDAYGHAAGDQVLVALAQRLHTWCAARRGTAARLGGDEFAAVARVARGDAAHDLFQLRRAFDEPVPYQGRMLPYSVSVGAAHTADLPGRGWGDMLRAADTAMYRAKTSRAVFPVFGTAADVVAAPVHGRRPGRPGTHLTPAARDAGAAGGEVHR